MLYMYIYNMYTTFVPLQPISMWQFPLPTTPTISSRWDYFVRFRSVRRRLHRDPGPPAKLQFQVEVIMGCTIGKPREFTQKKWDIMVIRKMGDISNSIEIILYILFFPSVMTIRWSGYWQFLAYNTIQLLSLGPSRHKEIMWHVKNASARRSDNNRCPLATVGLSRSTLVAMSLLWMLCRYPYVLASEPRV